MCIHIKICTYIYIYICIYVGPASGQGLGTPRREGHSGKVVLEASRRGSRGLPFTTNALRFRSIPPISSTSGFSVRAYKHDPKGPKRK